MKNIFLLLILIFSSILFSQTSVQKYWHIYELQNARIVSDGKLYSFLRSQDSLERIHAAIAVANIQDSTSLSELYPLLNDTIPSVRKAALFAIGQIGKSSSAEILLQRISQEENYFVKKELFDALGKCGTKEHLQKLATLFSEISDECYIQALLRFANRRIKDSAATEILSTMLKSGNENSIKGIFYTLSRIQDTLFIKNHLSLLFPYFSHPSFEVRMWCAASMKEINNDSIIQKLCNLSLYDSDWRVRVNALRALKNHSLPEVQNTILSTMYDSNEHVSLTVFSSLEENFTHYDSVMIYNLTAGLLYSSKYSERQRGKAAILFAKLGKEESIPLLISCYDSTTSTQLRANIITALGETKSKNIISFLKEILQQKNNTLLTSVIESYQKTASKSDMKTQEEFYKEIIPLFEMNNAGVSYSIAIALQDTMFIESLRAKHLPQTLLYYGKMKSDVDGEAMVELIIFFEKMKNKEAIPLLEKSLQDNDKTVAMAASKALFTITSKEYKVSSSSTSHIFYQPKDLEKLQHYHSATIETSQGNIHIDFYTSAAPYTVLNFILLAEKGFYSGLPFHRVVPNFVIQGGDPLGSGFGGPGYAIRTEVFPDVVYSTGAVGMASAGKDTEGSQFFITHSPTPHLDGRYTIFGYTKDMNVVEKIQVGEKIISVKLNSKN